MRPKPLRRSTDTSKAPVGPAVEAERSRATGGRRPATGGRAEERPPAAAPRSAQRGRARSSMGAAQTSAGGRRSPGYGQTRVGAYRPCRDEGSGRWAGEGRKDAVEGRPGASPRRRARAGGEQPRRAKAGGKRRASSLSLHARLAITRTKRGGKGGHGKIRYTGLIDTDGWMGKENRGRVPENGGVRTKAGGGADERRGLEKSGYRGGELAGRRGR